MPEDAPALQVHAIVPRSRANGPGLRWTLWVQGCGLRCPGCFNPATHPFGAGRTVSVRELLEKVRAGCGTIEGVTLSGGEPIEQPVGVLALLEGVRRESGISTLLFSGFRIEEIARRPLGREILARLDVLVDGRYEAALRVARGLRGSSNQRVHLLTPRYTRREVERTPVAEAILGPDGRILRTGVRWDLLPVGRTAEGRLRGRGVEPRDGAAVRGSGDESLREQAPAPRRIRGTSPRTSPRPGGGPP